MILSDKSIEASIYNNVVGVDPNPTADQYQPASLDVRLGTNLYNADTGTATQSHESHTIAPQTRYIAHTHETIRLPRSLAAQLTGRSTVGRKGIIVHKTAGWIDPSFEGQITLEVYNLGTEPVELPVYGRVAQLVFFQLDEPSDGYDGQYQGQTGIETSGTIE